MLRKYFRLDLVPWFAQVVPADCLLTVQLNNNLTVFLRPSTGKHLSMSFFELLYLHFLEQSALQHHGNLFGQVFQISEIGGIHSEFRLPSGPLKRIFPDEKTRRDTDLFLFSAPLLLFGLSSFQPFNGFNWHQFKLNYIMRLETRGFVGPAKRDQMLVSSPSLAAVFHFFRCRGLAVPPAFG